MSKIWHWTEEAVPEADFYDVLVDAIGPSGGQHELIYHPADGLWWLPDRSMYVYYTPTMWSYK